MVAKFFFFVINAHKPFIKCHLINSLKISFQILKIEEYSGKSTIVPIRKRVLLSILTLAM